VENILSKKSFSSYYSPIESSGLNNTIIVKPVSEECKVFLKGKKIPLRKEEELRGCRR